MYTHQQAQKMIIVYVFYTDFNTTYQQPGSHNMIIVMGDLNDKDGQENDALREVVGYHVICRRNERGDM